MISKKRYWGLALPIYDCRGLRRRRGHRRARGAAGAGGRGLGARSRATRRTGRTSTRSRIACPWLRRAGRAHHGRRQPVARRRHRAVLHAPLPRGPGLLGEVVPGRLHHRELPGPVPQLVLLDARDVAPCCAASRRSRRSSATPRCSARTAGRCTRAGATRSSSTRRPSGWASTSCAGCSPRRGRRTTSSSAGTPPTRRAASCWSCGTCTRSSSPTRGSPAGRRTRGRAAGRRARRRSTAGSCRGPPGPRPSVEDRLARLRRGRGDAGAVDASSTTSRRGTCAGRASGCARSDDAADRDAAFATLHEALVALARMLAPILPFLAEAMYRNLVVARRRRRRPTAST